LQKKQSKSSNSPAGSEVISEQVMPKAATHRFSSGGSPPLPNFGITYTRAAGFGHVMDVPSMDCRLRGFMVNHGLWMRPIVNAFDSPDQQIETLDAGLAVARAAATGTMGHS
jgi:hypothetical protein